MKRSLPFILIAAVAIVTVSSGALLYRSKRAHIEAGATANGTQNVKPEHVRGEADAPVTLEEFADFQCPSCAMTTMQSIGPMEKNFGERLRVVFWHFPLPNHKHGREAAIAAEAASRQGKFWEMHDLLFEKQGDWSKAPDIHPVFEEYAQQLKLDVDKFKKDCESPDVAAAVDKQHEQGETRGVKNTPTIFINGRELPPPFNPERIQEAIDAAIAAKNS
ncbi:MAG TPA: thioredoxin domain-containing protein [Chthoniobacterales bacterium]|nr:thioredoxin domain-containing protein [Chthoniobacterales bacterium]